SIGLDTTYGIENGDSNRVLIRTNYGYSAGGLSNSYPINNYQGIGSGAGFLHTDFVDYPQWNQGTQTAFFKSRPFPWIFYPDSLDLSSIKFVSDYPYYSDKAKLVELIIDSLMNVELEVAIRIQPDGTIQYSWRWTSLGNFDWLSYATDSIWFALDRTMSVNGRLEYYYLSTSSFQAVYNSAGLGLTADSLLNAKKYAACFFDSVRPDFGLGFHYGDIQTQGGASISLWPGASNDSGSVQIVATNMFPAFSYPGNLFRQNFFNFGYLAEIDSKYELLKNYLAFLSNT
ncbi:MAG TPA: hypothetical protein PKK94_18330, partial [Leptospiraceae bacterium]|nr:hypothetical protein [Leptospiraceae bacterium]